MTVCVFQVKGPISVHTVTVCVSGERPYKCPHCDYAGTQSGSLKYHLQRHHREQRNSTPPLPSPLPPRHRTSQEDPFSADSSPSHTPRHAQDWPRERKAAGPQRGGTGGGARAGADPEGFPYSLGVMVGGFSRGGQRGWVRLPSTKQPKASRRKQLSTTRLAAHSDTFEPLDLSRRPPLEAGGGVTLSQCLFCPFRTSSAELMAMHLQVNHTSKSRRKRAGPGNSSTPRPPPPLWTSSTWAASRAAPANGFSLPEEEEGPRGPDSPPTPTPSTSGAGASEGHEEEEDGEQEEEEEEDEQQEEEEEMEEGEEHAGSPGDRPGQEPSGCEEAELGGAHGP